MTDIGPEQDAGADQEWTPQKENPKSISTVSIPAVGKINGKDIRFGIHREPLRSIVKFFNEFGDVPELSIQGRILRTKSERDAISKDPQFNFLSNSRLQVLRTGLGEKFHMICPKKDAEGNRITDDQALSFFSDPLTPKSSAEEIGYDVGFVPYSELRDPFFSKVESPASYLVRACTEFNIGSSTLPPQELDNVARSLEKYIFDQEVKDARKGIHPYIFPDFASHRFIPLEISNIPPIQ